MVDIQSPAAEIRRGKNKIDRKIVTIGQKYNGAAINTPMYRVSVTEKSAAKTFRNPC